MSATSRPPRRTRPASSKGQLSLPLPAAWGGKRRGAGRKPSVGRSSTPHRALAEHKARHPVHVTLRSAFRPLRSGRVFPTLRIALARANRRDPERFRILHYSVQHDHVHLIVEASDEWALSSGVRSVAIRMARYVNELVLRKGRFWADRWFGRALTTPRQVRNALVYVLQNFRKHAQSGGADRKGANLLMPRGVDPFSSGLSFDGWRGFSRGGERAPPLARRAECAESGEESISRGRSWLATAGWRVHGLVRIDEVPRGV